MADEEKNDRYPVKFLVIRFSSIGDIVLTTPVVRCLKQQVDNAEIHFLTKKEYTDILSSNPYISAVHTLDNNFPVLLDELKNECFDFIIDLHRNIRSNRVKSALKLAAFTFNKLNFEKWLLVNFGKNRLPDVHIVDRYMETVKVFDVSNDGLGLDYFIPKEEEVDPVILLHDGLKRYIAFSIGAKHYTKQLPVKKAIEICTKVPYPVILLGGSEDQAAGKKISDACGDRVANACGKFGINGSASLVRQAEVVITNDTGLMHIAAAFKKKILSVWGNTVPSFGMYPYLPHPASEIIEVNDLKCRPCTKLGFRECPKKHFHCMEDIDAGEIAAKVCRLFEC